MKIAFIGENEAVYEKIIKGLPDHISILHKNSFYDIVYNDEADINVIFTDEEIKDEKVLNELIENFPYTLLIKLGESKFENNYDYTIKEKEPSEVLKEIKKIIKELESDSSSIYSSHLIRLFERHGIIGRSEKIIEVYKLVDKVSNLSITVLLEGESGTGKELFAKVIHKLSLRKDKPFVAIHCGAIPENLLEDELFGHKKGAFTGAINDREGKFELAHGGTIFLDEISTMSPALQVKLLRVLQEKEVERIGENSVRKVDVRVIAATNVKLENMIKEGKFREDLYYRLNVFPIIIPPLRERKDDIPVLATHILRKFCKDEGIPEKRFSLTSLKLLQGYNFPGNVRELENTVKRAAILSGRREVILPEDLPPEVKAIRLEESSKVTSEDDKEANSLTGYVQNIEKKLILQTLEKTGWNKKRAAELLNIKRTTLLEKIKKYGIDREK